MDDNDSRNDDNEVPSGNSHNDEADERNSTEGGSSKPLLNHPNVHTQPAPSSNFPLNQHHPTSLNSGARGSGNERSKTSSFKDGNAGSEFQRASFVTNSLSSLPLQMLLYFHYHYTPLFFILNICLFTYKGQHCSFLFRAAFFSFFCFSNKVLLSSKISRMGTNNHIFIFIY
jgi:hypothetical protein